MERLCGCRFRISQKPELIMKGDFQICHYCQEPTRNPTKDHKFPKSKIRKCREKNIPLPEGVDLNNNVVWACGACNILKGNKDYDSFISLGLKAIRHMKGQFMNKSIKKHRRKQSKR